MATTFWARPGTPGEGIACRCPFRVINPLFKRDRNTSGMHTTADLFRQNVWITPVGRCEMGLHGVADDVNRRQARVSPITVRKNVEGSGTGALTAEAVGMA